MWQIRLPRICAAAGAALAAAGATYHGLFRNRLVSPDILGFAAGAGLGAVLGIFLSRSVVIVQALEFLGGPGAVLVVYLVGSAIVGAIRCWCWPASPWARCWARRSRWSRRSPIPTASFPPLPLAAR